MITDPRNRDPLAIVIALLGLMSNIGVWVWWGGHIDARQDSTERRVMTLEAQEVLQAQTSAAQSQNIAVLTVKLDDIKASLDSVNRKLDRGQR